MIPVTSSTTIFVAVEPVDFRRQLDGLMAHCRQHLSSNPMSGAMYVFINRAKTMIRVLVYDGSGMWLMTKRLSNHRFTGWPGNDKPLSSLSAKELMQIIRTSRGEWASGNPIDP